MSKNKKFLCGAFAVIFGLFIFGLTGPQTALAQTSCPAVTSGELDLLKGYDADTNGYIDSQEKDRAISSWGAREISDSQLLIVLKYWRGECKIYQVVNCKTEYDKYYWCGSQNDWSLECKGKGKVKHLPQGQYCKDSSGGLLSTCVTCFEPVQNDPVSGTLSVSSTQVNVGEDITLTITGQDDNGLTKLWAYYQNKWHSKPVDGTSAQATFTFKPKIGTHTYKGYVYGKQPSGVMESAWTEPKSVKVTVAEVRKCTDSDGGKDYYTKGYCSDSEGNRWDYCANENILMEYYCQDSNTAHLDYQCPYGCEDGACLREAKKPDLIISDVSFNSFDGIVDYVIKNQGGASSNSSISQLYVNGSPKITDPVDALSIAVPAYLIQLRLVQTLIIVSLNLMRATIVGQKH